MSSADAPGGARVQDRRRYGARSGGRGAGVRAGRRRSLYGLTTLADGKSETVIDVPLSTLQKEQFAINGHKSAAEASTYVFCGNIGPQ